MTSLPEVQHLGIGIHRTPAEVYRFVSILHNLARWASGLGETLRVAGGEVVAEGPLGRITVRFVAQNDLGVLDHDVVVASGEVFHNPMRVIPSGPGSEIVFSLVRQPGVSDERFEEDARWIERDLETLKALLEA